MSRRVLVGLALVVGALAIVTAGGASAPPVGPLPAGPHATVTTRTGELVAVALPHRSGGRVWRIARAFDPRVVKQVSEADVGTSVVLVFKALHSGKTTLAFALTRGETPKALEARTYKVVVS